MDNEDGGGWGRRDGERRCLCAFCSRSRLDGRKDPGSPAGESLEDPGRAKGLAPACSHARQTHKTLYILARAEYEAPDQAVYASFLNARARTEESRPERE